MFLTRGNARCAATCAVLMLAGCAGYSVKGDNWEGSLDAYRYSNARANNNIREDMRKDPSLRLRLAKWELGHSHSREGIEDLRAVIGDKNGTAYTPVARSALCDALLEETPEAELPSKETEDECKWAGRLQAINQRNAKIAGKRAEAVEAALEQGDPDTAWTAITAYAALPTAEPARVAIWKSLVADLVKEHQEREAEKQRQAAAEEAEERRARARAVKATIATLRAENRLAVALSAEQFKAWIMSSRTVMGAQMFTRADVVKGKDIMGLWVSDPGVISANGQALATYCNAFVAWCNCDGKMVVGFDQRYLGGGLVPVFMFAVNPDAGQCSIGHN